MHKYNKKDAEEKCAVRGQHWEKEYKQWAPSKNMKATEGADFSPKRPDKRKTTYVKVNDTDH